MSGSSYTRILENYRLTDEHQPETFNLRLIEAVKRHECLYNSTAKMYRSSEYKTKIWNRLIRELDFDGDWRTLYARWKQLRDKYGKEKKKLKYHSDQSTWQYYKYLGFLDPHMIDRNTTHSPARSSNVDVHVAVTDPNWGISLIEEVRVHPCLFDIRDAKYRHSDCRNQAWQDVIKNLNFPGDVNGIYKQWKKLRDRYVREKRRIREQQDRGIEEESTWDLFQHMRWMDPYLDERQHHTNLKRKHEVDSWSDHELEEIHEEVRMTYEPVKGPADVLLDGDSAFAASIVADLRTLPKSSQAMARALIEEFIETGHYPLIAY